MNYKEQLRKIEDFFNRHEVPEVAGAINPRHTTHNLKRYVNLVRIRIHDLSPTSSEYRHLLRNLRYIAKRVRDGEY